MSRREIKVILKTEIAERIDELEIEAKQIRLDIDILELELLDIEEEIEQLEQEDLET